MSKLQNNSFSCIFLITFFSYFLIFYTWPWFLGRFSH